MLRETFVKALAFACLMTVLMCCTTAALSQEATEAPATAAPETAAPAPTAAVEPPAPAVVAPAPAATAPAAAPTAEIAELWGDFIHYIRLARADMALSYGSAIVNAKADPREIYRLSLDKPDTLEILGRGEKLEGLADTVVAVRKLVEDGYRLESRDPEQIAKSIDMLGGILRQYQIGAERLQASGEFAIPQLIQRLGDSKTTSQMRDRIISVLPTMGKDIIRPLSAALACPDPSVREVVCRVLGQIRYWQGAPYLRAVLADPKELDRVKTSATAALIEVAGRGAAEKPVASLFYELADKYYTNQDSLKPDTRYGTANVWFWQEGLGLTYREVPTSIFMDVYAMRSARESLTADNGFYPAVSLWLAANIRKEAHLPAGVKDPVRGADQVGADAYIVAAGAKYAQEVLTRALADKDWDVAIAAIRALAISAGAENLAKPAAGGATPLGAALTASNLRVRFMAADALANALPRAKFNGDQLVISILAQALRQTGSRTVMLVDPNEEARNKLKDAIRAAGYEVIDGENLGNAVEAARKATGVDLVILSAAMVSPDVGAAVAQVRSDPMFSSLPVVLLADAARMATMNQIARDDVAATVVDLAGEKGALEAGLKLAGEKAVGRKGMTDAEASNWAKRAADDLRMLGQTRTTVFDLSHAEPALIDGLKDKRDEQKVSCAQALAMLGSGTAQQAIVELAMSQSPESVRIAAFKATAECVRQIGNQLTEAQANAVVDVVTSKSSQPLRDSASELLGALNLPSQQIKSLITVTKGND